MPSSAIVGAENCSWNHDRYQAVEHSGDLLVKYASSDNLADLIAMKSNSSLRSSAGIIGESLYSPSLLAVCSSSSIQL